MWLTPLHEEKNAYETLSNLIHPLHLGLSRWRSHISAGSVFRWTPFITSISGTSDVPNRQAFWYTGTQFLVGFIGQFPIFFSMQYNTAQQGIVLIDCWPVSFAFLWNLEWGWWYPSDSQWRKKIQNGILYCVDETTVKSCFQWLLRLRLNL